MKIYYLPWIFIVAVTAFGCNKTDWDSLPFYMQYELNGKEVKGAGFVDLSDETWTFQTVQSACEVDSCVIRSQAFYSNSTNDVHFVFEFYNKQAKDELTDSNGQWRYNNLMAFTSGLLKGEQRLCDGNNFPCINIIYNEASIVGYDLYNWPASNGPVNDGDNYFKINKLEAYDIEDVPSNSSLYGQVKQLGRGSHIIYLDATYQVKLYNYLGESVTLKNAGVRTMLVN
jgi:hypothetical protein